MTLRVAFLTSDAPRQRALAVRIAQTPGVELVGIAVQAMGTRRSRTWVIKSLLKHPGQLVSAVATRLFHGGALAQMQAEELRRFGVDGGRREWPQAPIAHVNDINGADAVAFLQGVKPDLIAVSGTKIVKAPIFALKPREGFLNLHTGISPYYKGGPNCTLWALANGEPQMIGATLHELDPGIDTGRLIITAQTPLDEGDNAASAMWKTVGLGADLYERVLGAIAAGERPRTLDQKELGDGRTYFTREWNAGQLARALAFVRSRKLAQWVRSGRPGAPVLFDGLDQKP